MNFELLPNETILDVFEYIPTFDLFHGFYNLNSRFNQLLQFRKFHLDFRLLSKTKCNYICKNDVPLVINRITSLHLSDDDNTPQIIQLFLSQRFQLRQFSNLQSITIAGIRCDTMLDQIIIECSHLPCLTHLILANNYISMSQMDADRFYNHVWSLKNLTYCNMHVSFTHQNYFPNPTVISTSLKHLIVGSTTCSVSKLAHLCHYTPNLERLSTWFDDNSNLFNSILPIQSINRLNIRFASSIDILKQLLRNLPNLCYLTWEGIIFYINGYQWEKIIRQYLPKLKIFQFEMRFVSSSGKDKESQLNEIIETFGTKFWIDEHRWFVQCHWCSSVASNRSDKIHLFTSPYAFSKIYTDTKYISVRSTDPSDNEYLTFNNVDHLVYRSRYFAKSTASRFRFDNISHLTLSFPFDDQFLSIVSKFDRLVSLKVLLEEDTTINNSKLQLQFLLDQAHHLRSLTFVNWLEFNSLVPSMEIKSSSVRQLNLQGYVFDEMECTQLCRSSLGRQCENLSVSVKNRRNIIDLVNNMPNLQVLRAQSDDDAWSDENYPLCSADEELVGWLQRQLPSTCSIMRSKVYSFYDITLWIR